MQVGAAYKGNGRCSFCVWAPFLNELSLEFVGQKHAIPLLKDQQGYYSTTIDNVTSGQKYSYRYENKNIPDPASAYQPDGVHGPSEVVDHGSFDWADQNWRSLPIEQFIIYEIHTGTFTPEGTFAGIASRLDELIDLGITAIEIMPVSQFPGVRNWGYDGAYPFAVQNSYGGPSQFKALINTCHHKGLAVILDVVYNHFGPEGTYVGMLGPYFTEKYKTPWGKAINFDDAFSDDVRNYFIENALHWFKNYHIDALRLDAVHAIYDFSAVPFLQELADKVGELSREIGRKFYLIAESDLNDVRIIKPLQQGGFGLDAQWCDDFHHSLHCLLTGEKMGYYSGFGSIDDLAKSYKDGFVYSWKYSEFRHKHYGSSSAHQPSSSFVVCSQNHDQIGNRMLGERLTSLVTFEALKLAAATVLLSPYVPLLFMGEEYAEHSQFLYFVDHGDPALVEAVRAGRKSEFAGFEWQAEPPDPQSTDTFTASTLKWYNRSDSNHAVMLAFYKKLIGLRKSIPALFVLDKQSMDVQVQDHVLMVHRYYGSSNVLMFLNFKQAASSFRNPFAGRWTKILDSADDNWAGPGSKLPCVLEQGRHASINPVSMALYAMEKL